MTKILPCSLLLLLSGALVAGCGEDAAPSQGSAGQSGAQPTAGQAGGSGASGKGGAAGNGGAAGSGLAGANQAGAGQAGAGLAGAGQAGAGQGGAGLGGAGLAGANQAGAGLGGSSGSSGQSGAGSAGAGQGGASAGAGGAAAGAAGGGQAGGAGGGTAGGWVGTPPGLSLGRGEKPVVLWPRPAHAHPQVPFEFTFVALDAENEAMHFGLDGAPGGMTIDDRGTVRWAAPVAGNYTITLEVDDGRAEKVKVPFSLEVDPSHFLFVAADGKQDASGTIDDPLADIEEALKRVKEGGWGTVFVRGGTYATPWQWEAPGLPSPIRGANGTAEHPFALRGYPGEAVVLDCGGAGNGPWSFGASYWHFTDLEVRNPNRGEAGGMVLETFSLAQNVTVRDANWDHSMNCTGFLLRGEESICHRCRGIDNYDRTSDHWNSSNYLVYLDGDEAKGTRYILESLSSGSVAGIKVKHAGPARLLVHASRSEDDDIGITAGDDGSEVRYCTVERAGVGLLMGMADPNEYTRGDVSFHHDTVVDAGIAFSIQHTYADLKPVQAHHLVLSSKEPLGATEDARHLAFVWAYASEPPVTLAMDQNCLAAPSFDVGFRHGKQEGSLADWKAHGHDASSVSTAPIAFDEALRLPAGSPCVGMGALEQVAELSPSAPRAARGPRASRRGGCRR